MTQLSWLQAIPTAVAGVRDLLDSSPQLAVDFLLSSLEQGLPPGGILYDEDACTASFLDALGLLRPRDPAVRLVVSELLPQSAERDG